LIPFNRFKSGFSKLAIDKIFIKFPERDYTSPLYKVNPTLEQTKDKRPEIMFYLFYRRKGMEKIQGLELIKFLKGKTDKS